MKKNFTKEEEATITFLAWSTGQNIDNISDEIKNGLYPTISQMPESSKRMCYRLGSIMIKLSDLSNYNDKFYEMNDKEDEISYSKNLAKLCVKDLELNEELNQMYLDFAYIFIGIRYDKNLANDLHEQMKIIVAKESN